MQTSCLQIMKRYDFRNAVISQLHYITPQNALSSDFREAVPTLLPLISELPCMVPRENSELLHKFDGGEIYLLLKAH